MILLFGPLFLQANIDVSLYMDPSPHIVYADMVAYQSLKMFTALGLRHLPVVNANHRTCTLALFLSTFTHVLPFTSPPIHRALPEARL